MRPSLRAAVKTLLEVNMSGWLRFTASFSTLAGLSLAMVSLWGCSAQEEVQSLEKRVTALEAALTDPAASVKARARAINRQFEA